MKKNIYYSLLISAMVAVSVAEETRQVDKHEHGVGELNIAIEGNAIDFEFFIPGADIVGFNFRMQFPHKFISICVGSFPFLQHNLFFNFNHY
ncbi:MAG: hypothetical protein CBE24_03920 [bacterium TMED264]|nr:MAG: hypothetical protein CBE24_03920 [bacterium TMED264]